MKSINYSPFQLAASFREVETNGIKFLVVPGIAVVESVLNFSFLPFAEIERFHRSWNGRPLTIDHPATNLGSAGSPDQYVIGYFYNASVDESAKSLRGEFWFNVNELQKSEDGKFIEQNIRQGKMMELSTGFFADTEDASGVFNDIEYFQVFKNLVPDHIAILPHAIGACSNESGCGVPRLNASCGCHTTEPKGSVLLTKEFDMSFLKNWFKKPDPVKLNWKDPKAIAVLLQSAGFEVEVQGEGDAVEMVVARHEEDNISQPVPQADPFVTELKLAFGDEGIAGFKILLNDLQGVVTYFKGQQELAQNKKAMLVEKLKANKLVPFSEVELNAFNLEQLAKIEQSFVVTNANFRGMGFGDPSVNNNAEALPRTRGIGLSGTLSQKN